jgi:hypothetical protein
MLFFKPVWFKSHEICKASLNYEISGSHGGENEDGSAIYYAEDGGSNDL